MDFAKLVTEYMNQRTEGDPSFIVSEESIAFVDLMRADDMDRRASSVESQTSSDTRGEPSSEEITSESKSSSVSESYSEADPFTPQDSPEVITTPASPYSDIALGGNQDAGVISNMPEADTEPSPGSVFTEDSQQSQPSQVFSEDTQAPEPSQVFTEDPQQSEPSSVFTEDHESTEPSSAFTEDSPQSEPSPQVTEDQQPAEPAAVFTEDGNQAAPNGALQEEGVAVTEHVSSNSNTTIIAPQSMPDFESILQSFDRDYRPPDPPAGDLDVIPTEDEPEPSEPLQNTTEFCEAMMSEILSTHLAYDRRGA